MSVFPVKKKVYTRTGCVCQCLWGSGPKAECVSEEKKGICSRRLFLLPAVSPQERPASMWLRMIDRHPFSSMRIGSDLKQVLPFLTEWLSSLHLPSLSAEKGWEGHGARWLLGQEPRVIQVWGKGNCYPCVWAHVLKWGWREAGGGLHSSEWKENTTLKSRSVCLLAALCPLSRCQDPPVGQLWGRRHTEGEQQPDSHWTNSI